MYAFFGYYTFFTFRVSCLASVSSMKDKKMVGGLFVLIRDDVH
jgi:hypothetical protein